LLPATLALVAVLCPGLARGQDANPPAPANSVAGPGPFVIDVRGTTLGVPQTSDFYPAIPGETVIPARGFGAQGGVHVYPIALGTRRLGFGADLFLTRGTATTPTQSPTSSDDDGEVTPTTVLRPDVAVTVRTVSAQVSINFGTSRGWSYLTAGGGPARVEATAGSASVTTTKMGVNAGAGARWFVSDHVGVGFDLRAIWVGSRALFGASVGLSVK
jgi:opacity protein-like surface antigen